MARSGRSCRKIIMDVVIVDGVEQQAYRTNCREPDGSWKIKTEIPQMARSGRSCREIIMDVVIDGVEQQAYGTACREPDGS